MITQAEYKKTPGRLWIGKRVRTREDLRNGNIEIPAGTILIIERKYRGFGLRGVAKCQHCKIGRVISINRVPPESVELLDTVDED